MRGFIPGYIMEIDIKAWAPRLARSVLRNSLALKKGEKLTIEAWSRALPWVDAFLTEAREMGVRPMVIYESDAAFWASLEAGRTKSLGVLGAQEFAALRESNAYVYFWGPADRTRWHKLPSATVSAVTAYEDEWFKIAKEAKLRWCRIELARATEELAREYRISYSEWVRELLEASTVNPEPMIRNGRKIADTFENGQDVVITHRNGTRLELHLKGRKPFVDDGVVDEADVKAGFGESNVPSGVVTVAVDESFAEGKLKANRPTRHGPSRGRSDEGEWTFENGKLSKYSYGGGEKDFSRIYLKSDHEVRDRPAILSIGLNPKIRDSPLFEDQELGVIAFYIGSNEWLGGSNKGDFHSWLLLRGADLTVDGEVLLKGGKLI
ncbi:MAG: aminopeptidase [Nitrososphaerales archaeon]